MFQMETADYLKPNGGIIFHNPNAPTGMLMNLDSIRTLLKKSAGSVVVIDEAYIDFGGESAVCLVPDFDNLLVVQTMSRAMGVYL